MKPSIALTMAVIAVSCGFSVIAVELTVPGVWSVPTFIGAVRSVIIGASAIFRVVGGLQKEHQTSKKSQLENQ